MAEQKTCLWFCCKFLPHTNLIDCLNQVRVRTTTGHSGPKIRWSLGDCSNNQTLGDKKSYTTTCCLNYGNHTLNCTIGGIGGFIEIQGKKYCEDAIDDGEGVPDLPDWGKVYNYDELYGDYVR